MKSKIYLASPFFNLKERTCMETVLKVLRASNFEVFAPYEFVIDDAWNLSNEVWGKQIFQGDVKEIDECDIVVAINHGLHSDSGTAFEIGYAFAKQKPIFVVYFEETLDSLMVNNAATGCINYKDFKQNKSLNVLDYIGITCPNEQK